MRLAFINFYSGIADRGGETYVASLADILAKKHEVFLFQAGPKKGNNKYQIEEVKVSFNPSHPHSQLPVTHILKRLFLDYSHLKELVFTLKLLPRLWKLKPAIIFPQNSGWEVFILRLFSSLINAKIIVAGQSGPGWNDRVNLFIQPDIFVALTQNQADWAKRVTPWKDQKIVVIPNGVDLIKFSPKGEKRVLELQKPIVFAVGAAINSKRISDTIKAVANTEKASLLVCGTGPNEKTEDRLGQELLGKRYKRLKVSHSDMPSIYRSADVFTLCSDSSEAFGIVYLEALASGLPCVVTDDASRHEILGKAGIYVKKSIDSIEYAAKINEAIAQQSTEKYLKQAGKFSWEKIAKEYENIF